jgi:hypothetical protein
MTGNEAELEALGDGCDEKRRFEHSESAARSIAEWEIGAGGDF